MTGVGQTGDKEKWGNGAASARLFGRQGAKIFGCDNNLSAAEHTAKRLRAEGSEITVVEADVTKESHVKKLVDECLSKYGRIDILVK